MAKEIELGHRVKDKVSGIKGTVVQTAQWLTGCDTVAVEPDPVEGKKQDPIILDINRVKFVDEGVRSKFFREDEEQEEEIQDIGPVATSTPTGPAKGGPHDQLKNPKHEDRTRTRV